MIDIRAPDSEHLFKSGGHQGMIKSIWVSEDESILYTGGSDGTMRLWDIGTRSVIQVYGEPQNQLQRNADDMVDEDYAYHTDSITTLQPSSLGQKQASGHAMLSAGRDGCICEVDILSRDTVLVH